MKKVLAFLFISTHAFAGGISIGGSTSRPLEGQAGFEVNLPPDQLADALHEALLKGEITVQLPEGPRKLVPTNFDFQKKILKAKDADNEGTFLFRELEAGVSSELNQVTKD